MRDYTKALSNLYPGVQWSLDGDEIQWDLDDDGIYSIGSNFIWNSDLPLPSKEELEAEVDRVEQEWIATEYQRQRQPEYPPLADLADALYWQAQGDESKMTAYLAAVDAVKQKYPKGV